MRAAADREGAKEITLQDVQRRMFLELERKEIFEAARKYAFAYIDEALERNVAPSVAAVEALSVFDEPFPSAPGDSLKLLAQLHELGSPATVASLGGRYFGFVNGSALPISLAARWLSDVWDQNTALATMSPVSAALEGVCERWLREIFGLPDDTVAGFVSGTSAAILCGLAAGRARVLKNRGWNLNAKGLYGAPPVHIIAGRHAHATVIKAIALLGLGVDNVKWVDVDDQGRILPDQLPPIDEGTILLLQAGNVNSGAFDDFESLCSRARRVGAWVHIDGAFGLWAAGSASLRHLVRGIELADSWSVDGHKTLNTPYDCGIVLCRDRNPLVEALQASGAYIVYSGDRDGMLYTPEMSRRARAVELWACLKSLGRDGLDQLVTGLHERALQMGQELSAAGFEILNDVVFNQVLVAAADDRLTEAIVESIQRSGDCWVGGSKWFGRPVIRVSICSWATTAQDISRAVRAFEQARERTA